MSKSQCGEYTMDDLHDLLFPGEWNVTGYLCMVYNCFLDDSKDGMQQQMVVSAGFFGTIDNWKKLRTELNKCLRSHGLEYFKSSEYKMLEGQFSKFKTSDYPPPTGREAARKIRTELQEVLRRHRGINGIGVSIPVPDFNEVCARPEAEGVFQGNPYHRALESVMYETVQRIRRRAGHNVVAFVHDDGPDFDELRAVYNGFRERNPKTAKFMYGFQPLDDKQHPELQAADMVANYTLGLGIEWIGNGREKLKEIEMKQSIEMLGVWDTHYMLSVLKHQLVAAGKPIPVDISSEEYG